ncbi:MAG: hypothetical protein RLZZ200_2551 [Pseudomonadota bacterium]|jgi:superfamily I DNA/RNA helicase
MNQAKAPHKVIEFKDWRPSLIALERMGGVFSKASKEASALAYVLMEDPDAWRKQKLTDNGCQIPKAVKIDLPGRARMIFIADSGCVILLYAGSHDNAERWCEKNDGIKFFADKSGKVVPIVTAGRTHEPQAPTVATKPLLQLLRKPERDVLLGHLPKLHQTHVLTLESSCSDEDIEASADGLADGAFASLLTDVLIDLRSDRVDTATRAIQEFEGTLKPIEEIIAEGVSPTPGPGMSVLPKDQRFYEELLKHYAKSSTLKDWMLLLHPDQESIVTRSFDGPAMLCGISGSGKTCVLVRRAMELAGRHPGETFLIVTLNRPLARLLQKLVNEAAPDTIRDSIQVKSFYDICRELLEEFDPKNIRRYLDVADKTENHVDDVWREYYQYENNNRDATVFSPVHDSLIARNVDAEGYIREEFDLIRSIAPLSDRERYLSAERTGRVHPVPEAWRKLLLQGLVDWEKKCWSVGVMDALGMAVAVHRHSEKIEPRYRSILVDESQDFGSVELDLLNRLAKPGTDNLFLAGDLAQRISLKSRNLTEIGISIPASRRVELSLNYRNSREILEVASRMLLASVPEEHRRDSDFSFVDPETSAFSGPTPRLLSAKSLEGELSAAVQYAEEIIRDTPSANVCIALAGYSEHEVQRFARSNGLRSLHGIDSIENGAIFLSDLENTKGFEFSQMIIVNLVAGEFPSPRCPEGEEWREACRLYVAMTRPRTDLTLSYHGALSPALEPVRDALLEAEWRDYVEGAARTFGTPKRLESLRWDPAESVEHLPLGDCTAAQFLLRKEARGLEIEFIGRLRELVTGARRVLNGEVREWRTMGEFAIDILQFPAARRVAGSYTTEQLRRLGPIISGRNKKPPAGGTLRLRSEI